MDGMDGMDGTAAARREECGLDAQRVLIMICIHTYMYHIPSCL